MASGKWLAALLALTLPVAAFAEIFATELTRVEVTTVAQGLENPWSVAFMPDGRMLVTERPGRMRMVTSAGELSEPLAGVPEVAAIGQGGLLDVALAPDFATSRQVFWSYVEKQDWGTCTSVARGVLGERGFTDVKVIFRQSPAADSPGHFGSRLLFAPDGALFVTLGERQSSYYSVRAQDLNSHFGKIVRLDRDGKALKDNPFHTVPGALPEIWSYGHRNVQGAALDPATGDLWITEHGPKGGDELNRVLRAANYGWPLVTYGIGYGGQTIGIGQERAGIESPVHRWVPSIATSGLAYYTGDRFPQWKNQLFAGGLYGMVVRLELKEGRVVHEERILTELKQRIRDVRQGPDGLLYVLTDSPKGRLFKVAPAP